MPLDVDKQILRALLERLLADAALPEPHFTSVVSGLERNALSRLLGIEAAATATGGPNAPEQVVLPASAAMDSQKAIPAINLTCLNAEIDPRYVVCIDFGTAKSKAFAMPVAEPEDPDQDMTGFELALGKRDSDIDGAVYSVASSVWIADDGLMFAGSEALRRSSESHDRRRLDSIKQELSQSNSKTNLGRPLDESINPTDVKLSQRDAICFFLAYLTDLVGRELEVRHSLGRYTRRRFTIPAWAPDQRKWANEELKLLLTRAQILADTFATRWAEGIPAIEVKQTIELASQYDEQLGRLLDPVITATEFGISEPMAAGAGRIKIDKSTKNMVLVIDVGAGTTDFGLFIVNFAKQTAIPVEPKSAAVRMAGNHVDGLLVQEVLSRISDHSDPESKQRIANGLWRTIRRDKEQLFRLGTFDFKLVNDLVITITLADFLTCRGVLDFASQIESELAKFLGLVHKSFEDAAIRPIMLLSGGGGTLPFIANLLKKKWRIGAREVMFQPAKAVPDAIMQYDLDFQSEYPQLAVALGGSVQAIDEKTALAEWGGEIRTPGPLSRVQVTGV